MESKVSIRFEGGPRTLYEFTDKFLVQCPNCHKRAEVSKNASSGQHEFHCYSCYQAATAGETQYKLSVNQYCPSCEYRVEVTIPSVKQKTSFIRLECPTCNITNKFTPTYESFVVDQKQDGETEPYFGIRLWLQDSFGSEILWAYNYEHLQHLKEYIQAKLRQRQAPDFSTMVERLPAFIKSAKNRDSLLVSIERLALKK